MKRIAVAGFGARAAGMLRNFNTFEMDAAVTAVYDRDPEGARRRLRDAGFDESKAVFYDDFERMLSSGVDGVCISTNCDTHTDLAVRAMPFGLPMLLEKPVAITMEQAQRLAGADAAYHPRVLVAFPLRVSTLCSLVKKILDSGEIGKVQHVQAVNNVTYGRVYYKDWYRNESVTGGLFLQKATHDLDYINFLLGDNRPVEVCAMESKQVFRGDMPAGITCEECERYHSCPESPFVLKNRDHGEAPYGSGCSFALDTGNHDSASILVRYADGVHASYSQEFLGRKAAARRGARLVGYHGTLEFDWITGVCTVYNHHDPRTTVHTISDNQLFHYGGDKALCENFVSLMDSGESAAPLAAGILSARLCLLARESAQTHRFLPVE